MMINAKDIRVIIGVIGNVLSTVVSLSYVPRFIQIYKKKSVEGYKVNRQLLMLAKCSLWVLYGIPFVHNDSNSILVSTSNGVGFVIEVIYVVVFWINCNDESRKGHDLISLIFVITFVSTVYSITILAFWSSPYKHILVGVVCDAFNIWLYLHLSLNKMEKNKNFTYMPFWLSLVSFINAGIWSAYALIYKIDIYVLSEAFHKPCS
ncbi:PREDICTED: bidirectional sugar transporter SWEET8-like [Camelina sativa]|uniref:Bidirectional sugar transporter SWEET8-like n=1 Tax=Camelina sativa TaxID=90675 RepID=A0ABM1QXJ2_CAMSA|nr:PREDICTED: bidirectional sugar transporter SWEET8-like [Camelina sativa]